MDALAWLVFVAVWALICYVMAEKRGRNPLLGIASGAVFGIFTVIYYWCVGDSHYKRQNEADKILDEKITDKLKDK